MSVPTFLTKIEIAAKKQRIAELNHLISQHRSEITQLREDLKTDLEEREAEAARHGG
jgi:uncharacterized coiled-coil protein SlyX